MQKRYDIKVYDSGKNYLMTINPNNILSDIVFPASINWWQWQLKLKLNLEFNDTSFNWWEIIEVTIYDDNHQTWEIIYYWFISKINRVQETSSAFIEIVCLWIASLLSSVIYYNGSYAPTVNQDPAQTIKDVIDYFNTQYTWWLISYSGWWIIDYGSNVSLKFNYDTCFSVIKKIAEATDYDWFIDSKWQIRFNPKPTQSTHWLTNEKDVEYINLEFDLEDIVNKFHLQRSLGTYKTYNDNASQLLYWIKEKMESKTDIQDEASQDEYWNNYLIKNADPKNNSKIVVNQLYNIESIEPWHTIAILNIDYEIDNLKIEKVSYSPDKISLEVEVISSLWKEINS